MRTAEGTPDPHIHGPSCLEQRTWEICRAIIAARTALERIELVDAAAAESAYALVDEAVAMLQAELGQLEDVGAPSTDRPARAA